MTTNIDAVAVLPFGADNLARLLRNLEDTSCNEGSEALACRLSDCRTVITELLADRAATVAKDGGEAPNGLTTCSIGGDPEFNRLLVDWCEEIEAASFRAFAAKAALVAYIDARVTSPKPEASAATQQAGKFSRVGKCVASGSDKVIVATAITTEWADQIVAALAAPISEDTEIGGQP